MANYINKKNNVITITRGDIAIIEFEVSENCKAVFDSYWEVDKTYYEFSEGDTIYFGLMDPFQLFEKALIRKRLRYGDNPTPYGEGIYQGSEGNKVIIVLTPEDTETLIPGTYYYSIKLRYQESSEGYSDALPTAIHTLIQNTKIYVVD